MEICAWNNRVHQRLSCQIGSRNCVVFFYYELFHQLYFLSYCKKGCFHHLNLLYQQQHQLIQTHHIQIQSYQILVYFHPHLLNLSPRLNQVSLSPGQCTHLEIYLIQQDNESILFHAYQSAQVIVSEDKS